MTKHIVRIFLWIRLTWLLLYKQPALFGPNSFNFTGFRLNKHCRWLTAGQQSDMLLNASRCIWTLTCLCYTWVSSMNLVRSESVMSMYSCNEVLTSFNWTLSWKPRHCVKAKTKYCPKYSLKHDLEEFSHIPEGMFACFFWLNWFLTFYIQIVQVAASRFEESFLLRHSNCLSSTGDDFCLTLFCSWLCFLQSLMSFWTPTESACSCCQVTFI